jgi:nitrite reductase/ring-hydroxylating ferredoxin subunit
MFGKPVDPEAEAARDAAFPKGWFALLRSEELKTPLGVAPKRAFGRDLVLWRTEDGQAHAANAECPHFGVHMGRGGTVKEDGLACPIHGLRFDRAGRCLPARPGKPAPELAIRTYPVRETGGVIHVWRHPQLSEPDEPGPADGAAAGAWRWTVELPLAAAAERAAGLADEGLSLFATPVETGVSEILAVAAADADAVLAQLTAALGAPDVVEQPPADAKPGWVSVQTA